MHDRMLQQSTSVLLMMVLRTVLEIEGPSVHHHMYKLRKGTVKVFIKILNITFKEAGEKFSALEDECCTGMRLKILLAICQIVP